MRLFKYILPLLVAWFTFSSCGKVTITPPPAIDTDALIHEITVDAPTQFVVTSVSGTKLTMIYYENVSLYIPSEGLDLSWAVHLKEIFTACALQNFDYTTIDEGGDITTDWVDDNLNQVTAKTLTDTTIAGIKITRITVRRPFTFSKAYDTAQEAIDEQTKLLNTLTDNITFSSDVYFGKFYPINAASANVFYLKSN